MRAPTFRFVLALLSGFVFCIPGIVAENLNDASMTRAANPEAMAEEVTLLPVKGPLLIAPAVKPPMVAVTPAPRLSKAMQKLALKYDIGKIGHRDVGKGMNFYSLDKEMDLGHELASQVDQVSQIVYDPVVTEYVNRLGQNLVRNSDAKVPFVIKVLDDPEVNAFALPGGYFYVNTGLILAADNEAELAGIMAHEIAHVAARHATHNMSRRNLISLCAMPAVFFGGPIGMAVQEAAEMALPAEYMKFSRDSEREADLLGMQYAYATGYDPASMVSFFEKMQAQDKKKRGFIARAFSSHPMTSERVRRAQEEMASMLPAKDEYVVTTSEFTEVKARLAAIVNHQLVKDPRNQRPVLRRSGSGANEGQPEKAEDERPTLRRGGN